MRLRIWVKQALRPFLRPLTRRLMLPLEVLQPRIEVLESLVRAGPPAQDLRRNVDSLTRVWLKLRNDVAVLTDTVPELVTRLRTLEARLLGFSGPHILAPDKLAAARTAGILRLHLGHRPAALPETVTVDQRDLPGVDIIADPGALPFPPGSIAEITCSHLAERVTEAELTRRLLPHWRGLLQPGGTLRMVTRDAATLLAGVAEGGIGFDAFRDRLFGGPEFAEEGVRNVFTPQTLTQLLAAAGFAVSAPRPPGGPSADAAESDFELIARVPADPSVPPTT